MPKYIPFCIGEYDSSVTCDGSPAAINQYDKKPCLWKIRCLAFQTHIKLKKINFDDYVDLIQDEDGDYHGLPKGGRKAFMKWCDGLAIKYADELNKRINSEEVITIKKKKRKKKQGPLKSARRASVKRSKEKAKARQAYLNTLYEHFKTHFIENLDAYSFTPPRGIIKPGRFYEIDRRKKSKYISIYCKRPGLLGQAIALIRFKPLTLTFDIELPVEITDYDFDEWTMKKIHPAPIDDGRFRSVCAGMDKEGVAIVAQTIAKMVKRGKIKLSSSG